MSIVHPRQIMKLEKTCKMLIFIVQYTSMIFSTARILELSIAAQNDERMQQERQAQIDATPPSLRRQAAERILKLAQDTPEHADALLNSIARLRGLNYVGTGVEYTVYKRRKSDAVIKIHRNSAQLTEIERRNLVCEKAADHGLLQNYLGQTVVPQTVDVGPHVFGGYRNLRVHQPFIEFTPEDAPFAVNSTTVDPAHLEKLVIGNPGVVAGLTDFVAGARTMHEKKALLPDTNGQYNVVTQSDGSVTLLDTTPINTLNPVEVNTTNIVLSQLRALEFGLREVS